MTIPVIAFFNNKGGVGKTSLVYHLAWMYSEQEVRVLAADLDPQANLTAAFLTEDRLEELWLGDSVGVSTIYDALQPLARGVGDILDPQLQYVMDFEVLSFFRPTNEPLAVLPGHLNLSQFEDDLSEQWPKCLDGKERAFRVTSAFWRILQIAGRRHKSELILVDLGPNLGAINRASLIASDYVVIPIAPDLFSLQGLRNLGPTLRQWRKDWSQRLKKSPDADLELPRGDIQPVGYVILQHAVRLDRPVMAYEKWARKIPSEYRQNVLDESPEVDVLPTNDPHCLALLKHYRSLMPMAQEARKPMFRLKPADGAIGSHFDAVKNVYKDFRHLAQEIARRIGIGSWSSKLEVSREH